MDNLENNLEDAINQIDGSQIKDASAIAADKSNYGKKINYEVSKKTDTGEKIEWEIFFADESNIYLISSNLAYTGKLENAVKSTKYNGGTKLLITQSSRYLAAEKWTKSWIDSGYESNTDNKKMMLYLLDNDVWQNYRNENYADWAIGGPTLDMLCKIWNETTDETIEPKPNTEHGYNRRTYEKILTASKFRNNGKTYWTAIPSDTNGGFALLLISENYTGGASSYSNGFRPIVCLNESVKLEWNDNEQMYELVMK